MSALLREGHPRPDEVELVQMRRRHLRQVLRIEAQVYPRPWSAPLFLEEMIRKYDRAYLVARWGAEVVGYGGVMIHPPEAHITTIAVDPAMHRRKIGAKIMLGLIDAATARGVRSISLEVRKSNLGAQQMYRRFGFRPIGVRRGYYVETGEDALVMWVDAVNTSEYAQLVEPMRIATEGSRPDA